MLEYPPGWTCQRITLRIERYVLNTLPRDEALAMAAHFEACAWCAERLVGLGSVHAGSGRRD
jgi:hypothetical protein